MAEQWRESETGARYKVATPGVTAADDKKKKKEDKGFIGNIMDFYHSYQAGKKKLLDSLAPPKTAKPGK